MQRGWRSPGEGNGADRIGGEAPALELRERGGGWAAGFLVPLGAPRSPHTSLEAVRLSWGIADGVEKCRDGSGGAERGGRRRAARGGKAEPRWSAPGRPSLLGPGVRRHPGRKEGGGGGGGPKKPADSALRESFCGLGLLYITQ